MNITRFVAPLCLLLAACGDKPAATPPLAGARIGGPFALVNGIGREVTDRSFAGRYRIMYFGYTFCPDVCPTDMATVGQAMRLLEKSNPALAAQVVPIFVTVDPHRDTPAVVGRFARVFHPRAVGLTGSDAAIEAVSREFGVYRHLAKPNDSGAYLVDHSRQTYLMGKDGQPLALLPTDQGAQATADEMAKWMK